VRIAKEDPLKAPSLAKRLAARVAMSDAGMQCAAWYLKNIVSRLEPLLDRWTHGRMTSLPITPVVFLKTLGARTGEPRVTPLTYFTHGDDVILIASNYGRRNHPAWYYNVKANPEVSLYARGRQGRYVVRETAGAERDRLWTLATQWTPPLAKYRTMAEGRSIPVMSCAPLD
jgi:deazaflavin-dependent oxidoreductase (nitroreductase family)